MARKFNFSVSITIPKGAQKALQEASQQAFEETAAILDGRFTAAMSSAVWDWPRPSKRGVGGSTLSEVASNWKRAKYNTGSPRDIIDSGDLVGSKNYNISGLSAEWVWTSEYAAFVHEGARIQPWNNKNARQVTLPARPWTTAVLSGGNSNIEVFDVASEVARRVVKFLE